MRLVFWVAAVIFVADQAVKYLVVHILDLAYLGAIDVFPPYLNLRMAWNYGINFGLFAQASDTVRWVLIAVALVISGGVLWWIRKEPPGRWGLVAAGLLIGGALGNVVDRVVYGAVADFLNMSCCGIENPYAFNIADISIFAGALGLVLFTSEKKAP
jgi:signal peptidase II